ncbi:uncharacterized protein HRG_10825 [Hirsutella rhossiliensis]|uniref:Uncharacterized protein n=1 Tax=Hirsutella rhossiliensis TaxID=111463 RepID=A0A9P8SE84_9HYPO|nr:uncharacterized protein HRG_10825 [Hirsutella rhossiliensis]KAH0958130.1 hypothetical protein HRG_10825 [Hirsutella rhossiliensis]
MSLFGEAYGYHPLAHNVTGDQGLDAPDSCADMTEFLANKPGSAFPVSKTALDLLSNPLPADLPTCDKDVLIVMAAYRGDLDRYCRCIWSTASLKPLYAASTTTLTTAIVARFIMNDDISWALTVGKGGFGHWEPDYPGLIFFPDIANSDLYEALARAVPAMRPAVARAAIYANYKALFDLVVTGHNDDFETVTPNPALYAEALQSPVPHYRNILERIARERGVLDTIKEPSRDVFSWEQASLRRWDVHVKHNVLYAEVYRWRDIVVDSQPCDMAIYDGVRCNAMGLERYLSPRGMATYELLKRESKTIKGQIQ